MFVEAPKNSAGGRQMVKMANVTPLERKLGSRTGKFQIVKYYRAVII